MNSLELSLFALASFRYLAYANPLFRLRLSEVKNCSLLRFGGFEAKLARKYPKSNSKLIFRTHHKQVIIINLLRLWSFLSSRRLLHRR